MVAEFGEVQLLRVVFRADCHAERGVDVADFLAFEGTVLHGFLHVEDLTAKRQDGLKIAVAALLGRSACGVALHEEEFALFGVVVGAVGQFAGESAAGHHRLALHQLACLAGCLAGLCGQNDLIYDNLGILRVLLQILFENLADGLLHSATDLRVAEFGLGLAFELRLGHFDGDDGRQAFAEVFRADFHLGFGQETVLFSVILERAGQSGAEADQVRTALDRVDIVDVRVDVLVEVRVVLHGHLDGDGLVGLQVDGLLGEAAAVAVEVFDELPQAFFGIEDIFRFDRMFDAVFVIDDLVCLAQVAQGQADALVEVSQFAETVGQGFVVVDTVGGGEDLRIRVEGDDGSRIGGFPHDLDVVERLALGILLHEDLAFAVDLCAEMVGEGVHAGDADAVQTAGNLVAVFAELTAGVEHREDHLEGGAFLLFVHARRDAAAVIFDGDGIVFVDGNQDVVAETGEGFVDGVVHDFIDEVMETTVADVADVHGRAFADGFESFEDLDTFGRILGLCLIHFFLSHFSSNNNPQIYTKNPSVRTRAR